MKKFSLLLLVALVVTSCGKWKDEHKELTYYSEDYKEIEMSILDREASEIDALWVEFSKDDKCKDYNTYAFFAKSNGELSKEVGTCLIDWENQITFFPNDGESYVGTWISGKEKYTITYNLKSRTEELTFIYKEIKDCKKGK